MPITDKTFATTPYEHAFGSILMRAHPPDLADCRNAEATADSLAATFAALSPLVARVEAFGAFGAGGSTTWTRKPGPGGRYSAGTAQGGLCISPPDWGIENSLTGTAPPATSPVPHLTLWGSQLGFGTPSDALGLTTSGFTIRRNGAQGAQELIVDTVNASGVAAATQALKLDSVASVGYLYGLPISTGSTYYTKSTTGSTGVISTSETIIAQSNQIPANTFAVGSIFRIRVVGKATAAVGATITLTVRFGVAGTTSDANVWQTTWTSAAAGRAVEFNADLEFVVGTAGASGQIIGVLALTNDGTTGVYTQATLVQQFGGTGNFDTTLSNAYVTATLKSSSGSTTLLGDPPSVVEIVKL